MTTLCPVVIISLTKALKKEYFNGKNPQPPGF
jgi:hypothetical protein